MKIKRRQGKIRRLAPSDDRRPVRGDFRRLTLATRTKTHDFVTHRDRRSVGRGAGGQTICGHPFSFALPSRLC